jgi:hypothetical protein
MIQVLQACEKRIVVSEEICMQHRAHRLWDEKLERQEP